jgi:hypothetical protein
MAKIPIAVDIDESKVGMSQLIMLVGHGWRDLWMVVSFTFGAQSDYFPGDLVADQS